VLSFSLSCAVLVALILLKDTKSPSERFLERLVLASSSVVASIYLAVLAFSWLGITFPFLIVSVGLWGLDSSLIYRRAAKGMRAFPFRDVLGTTVFCLVSIASIGAIFHFGSRYVVANVDHVAHVDMGRQFLDQGRIEVDKPFRYPMLTAMVVGIVQGSLPSQPPFFACQLVNIALLFLIAAAVRSLFVKISEREMFSVDVAVITVVYTGLLMNGLIYGFASMLFGVFFSLVTFIAGMEYRNQPNWNGTCS
jgi:hypothetical protein